MEGLYALPPKERDWRWLLSPWRSVDPPKSLDGEGSTFPEAEVITEGPATSPRKEVRTSPRLMQDAIRSADTGSDALPQSPKPKPPRKPVQVETLIERMNSS